MEKAQFFGVSADAPEFHPRQPIPPDLDHGSGSPIHLYHPSIQQANLHLNHNHLMPEGGFGSLCTIPIDGAPRFGMTAVGFDHEEELLWVGNSGGHVTSYFGPGLGKYTSFQAHATNEIRHLQSCEAGILILSRQQLRCQSRFGLRVFEYESPNLVEMQCMHLEPYRQTLTLGGHQSSLVIMDLAKVEQVRQVELNDTDCAILRRDDKFIYCGDTTGKITLRNAETLQTVNVIDAHSGTLSDFDVCGNKLVSCGFSQRHGDMQCDRFLKMYDLRNFRSLPPLSLPFDPLLLRFIPTFSDSRLVVVSHVGQFQILEIGATASKMPLYQLDSAGSSCTCLDISQTKQCLAFGDSGGLVHLWSDRAEPMFNDQSRKTIFPDPVILPPQPISFRNDFIPLSIIPLPNPSDGRLLSDWPSPLQRRVYRKALAIDPAVLRSMRVVDFIGYAPNPRTQLRNQVPYDLRVVSTAGKGKRRGDRYGGPVSPVSDGPVSLIPRAFRRVVVKQSKLFTEEFDYGLYNASTFSGLEFFSANCYVNAMLLLLIHLEPVRNTVWSHLCRKEGCLTCEYQFLIDTLMRTAGKQPGCPINLIRVFRMSPEAAALSLVLDDRQDPKILRPNYARLIQCFHRYLLRQLATELNNFTDDKSLATTRAGASEEETGTSEAGETTVDASEDSEPASVVELREQVEHASIGEEDAEVFGTSSAAVTESSDDKPERIDGVKTRLSTSKAKSKTIVDLLFSYDVKNINHCRCGLEAARMDSSMILPLVYPSYSERKMTFADVLGRSMTHDQVTQAYCDRCKRFQSTSQTRVVASLPEILALNCHVETEGDRYFWSRPPAGTQERSKSPSPAANLTETVGQKAICKFGDACNRSSCRYLHIRDLADPTPYSTVLPNFVRVSVKAEEPLIEVQEFADLESAQQSKETPPDGTENVKTYQLKGLIVAVQEANGLYHLVTCVKAPNQEGVSPPEKPPPEAEQKDGSPTPHPAPEDPPEATEELTPPDLGPCDPAEDLWIVYNDIMVTYLPQSQVLNFSADWKIPSIVYYEAVAASERYPVQYQNPVTWHALLEHESVAARRRLSSSTCRPLELQEIPKAGQLVGIDAEFVTLNQEEAELRSDGSRSMIKPSQMSVGRLTCIRGDGPLEFIPFIDDYIATQEEIVDYLTEVSGIRPGDLDRERSCKHLTTLKTTYLKLRYLLDAGIKFVGHGLKNDFRVINMYVPPDQLLDTVHLFHMEHHRMISLRFLAWYFLGDRIQSETHDSSEDARTALKLYRKFEDLSSRGPQHVSSVLSELYEQGRQLGWKIPSL